MSSGASDYNRRWETKTSLGLTYVGNHGVHIPIYNRGLNAFGDTLGLSAAAPTPIFTAFQQYSSSGISNYNGVTGSVSQRATYGLDVPVQLHLEPRHG